MEIVVFIAYVFISICYGFISVFSEKKFDRALYLSCSVLAAVASVFWILIYTN